MGFKTVIVIPDTQSQEKKDALRLLGAELIEVPAVPYKDPNNYVQLSGRLAEQLAKTETSGAIWANQFDNVANRQAHIEGTGPEIWEQTGGKIDGFTCAVGTGGTLGGRRDCAEGAQQEYPHRRRRSAGRRDLQLDQDRRAEDAMAPRSPKASARAGSPPIWKARRSTTPMRFPTRRPCPSFSILLEHEGLCMGGSTGINVAGAIRMAKDLGPGHTIVTILCDYGNRYQSKLFNPDFLREKGLPVPPWLTEQRDAITVPFE